MAKLPRVTVVQYGSTGPSTDFGQFGSKTAAAPQTSKDPTVIQQLAAWVIGWTAAAVGGAFNPYLEDMNGAFFVFGYFLANIFERGVPDWDAGTTYYQGAAVQDPAGSGQQFFSLTDNNLNNALPLGASNAQWRWNNPPVLNKGASATPNALPKIAVAVAPGGFPGSVATIDSALSDDGVNVVTALPIKFPDNTVQASAAVNTAVAAQNVVTGARALNTVFHNVGTRPLFVSVCASGSGVNFINAFTDANPVPATQVAQAGQGSSVGVTLEQLFFVVLPGNYYRVDAGGSAALGFWTEWS